MNRFQVSGFRFQSLIVATVLLFQASGLRADNTNVTNDLHHPVPVRWAATFYDNNQVTAATSAKTLVIARLTRRAVTFRNLDATISVYIGNATVTSTNGFLLKAGESVTWNVTGLVQVIAASGSPVVAYEDEYD